MSGDSRPVYLSAKCSEIALPDLPRLIFLDTNVVQCLQSFGGYIYDHYLASEDEEKMQVLGKRAAQDVEALAIFMDLGRRNGWPLAVSRRTLQELAATPEPNERYYLTLWGGELANYFFTISDTLSSPGNEGVETLSVMRKVQLKNMLRFLPQQSDRLLVIDALELGCDVFLTMDYRTIWRFRHLISPLGLNVMRPLELVKYIEPWVGLLR